MNAIKAKALAAGLSLVLSASLCRTFAQSSSSGTQADSDPARAKVGTPEISEANPRGKVAELFKQSKDLIEKDRASDAIPLLRKALELAPREGRIHHYLGYALMNTNQYQTAQQEFETALKLEPGNVYSEYFLALTLDAQGRREQAMELYEKIVASGTVIYDTYQRLGQAYARKKEFDKAVAMTQQALRQTPWDGALHYQIGSIYRQMGREDAARQELETATRLKRTDQSSIQKMLELTEAVRRKDTERALALRSELMDQSSHEPELMTSLGTFLGQGGLYREALEPLQKAMTARPCSYETCYNFGLTLAKLGREQEAAAPLKQALTLRPDSYEANLVLAVVYVNQGRNREAIERLRAVHAAKPDNPNILLLLGQQYLQGWYVQQAIDTFRGALKLQPDESRASYLLIEAYQNNEAYDKALEVARETLRLHPQEARAHFEVGHQLANLGHYQEGRPYFEESIRLDPSFVQAYTWLGNVELRKGEYEAALQSYQEARSLDSRDPEAARGIGRSLLRLKRYAEALTELQRCIVGHPEDAELHLQLSQVYVRLGKPEEAERARAVFETLHARELEKKGSQKPRTISP